MKISKLFHWLYAFLMMLPVFAVLSAVLINTFNMKAKTDTVVTYKYQSNEVVDGSSIIYGNVYHCDINGGNTSHVAYDDEIRFGGYLVYVEHFDLYGSSVATDETYRDVQDINVESSIYFACYLWGPNDVEIYFTYPSVEAYITDLVIFSTTSELSFDIVIDDFYSDNITDITQFLSISTYNEIAEVVEDDFSGRDVFYQSIEDVRNKPIFSWAYDSFLVAPFSYIVVLFGMPTNHVIVELLSYWLAISIIWLVFDLIMYVPLLVHRWLDKGVLE